MLTIYFEDLLKRPHFEFQKIFSYLSAKRPDEARFKEFLKKTLPNIEKLRKSSLFTRKDIVPTNLLSLSVSIIKNEMDSSKGLTVWPCPSFKSLLTTAAASSSPLVRGLVMDYHRLAANCSDPAVKCSVRFDMDEQN
jgi:hypothetical protein